MAKLAGAKLRALRSGFQLSSTSISILSYRPTEIKAFLSWQVGIFCLVARIFRKVCVTTHYTVKKLVEIPVYIYVDAADQTTWVSEFSRKI
jgi:hypothetical protein